GKKEMTNSANTLERLGIVGFMRTPVHDGSRLKRERVTPDRAAGVIKTFGASLDSKVSQRDDYRFRRSSMTL
ncbi:hypothetical protein, partial [Pseudomonas viridiflava]|uniref:hypothetical protein n=1 Tax=Pseudomonas viridiflava TaxID=33069 RepID=UPI0019825DFF